MENLEEFEFCLVGNIIDKHYYGENKEIKHGNKQFRSGAKVYIFPEFGGMGHENTKVIGLPRKSWKMIEITIESKMIKNVRIEKIHSKYFKQKICNNFYYNNWKKGKDSQKQKIQDFANFLNSQNAEITL